MTNWEKYKDELIEFACDCASSFGVRSDTREVAGCFDITCGKCIFGTWPGPCLKSRMKWLGEECIEPKKPEIDWGKVPVDTPVLVWDSSPLKTERGHFANYENGLIHVWAKPYATSWMAENDKKRAIPFLHAEIAPGIDCSKWYKE